jgi:hypothetical protein
MQLEGKSKIEGGRAKERWRWTARCAMWVVVGIVSNEDSMLTPENERQTEAVERTSRFQLGQVVATPGALKGDWGDLSDDDMAENEFSLKEGFRLLSSYQLPDTGEKIWIITEADRSITTLLLPEEY